MKQEEQPRFLWIVSVALASITYFLAWYVVWIVISFMVAFVFATTNPIVLLTPEVMLATGVVAAIASLVPARAVYTYARSPRSPEDENPERRLSVGDWYSAIASGILLCLLLLAFLSIPTIQQGGLKSLSISVLWSHGMFPFLLGVWNIITVLGIKRRKRNAAYRKQLMAAGRFCRCGYDLTGNVSGVCPECGESILIG